MLHLMTDLHHTLLKYPMFLENLVMELRFQFTSPGPIFWSIGSFSVRWYGLLIALAVIFGVSLSRFLAQRRNIDPELVSDLAIWLMLGAIPGARLYYVAFQWHEYANNWGEILAIWKGGIAIHGAILGGAIAAIIFCRHHFISFWKLADLVVPSLILGQAMGRWGNFFNSEAFGSPTDLPWKLYIPSYRRPPGFENIEYFHPTFLYESMWNLCGFSLLIALWFAEEQGLTVRFKPGTFTLIYLITYSLGRVWIEGLRTDSLMLGPLRIAQLVSIGGLVIGILGLTWIYPMNRNLPDIAANVISTRQ